MKCARKLFARALLSHSQLRRKPAQLERPSFQFRMTSTEGHRSFFVQRTITFLITTRLNRLLCVPALGYVQFESGEANEFSLRIAVGLTQTFYPQLGPVGAHNSKRVIPAVLCFRL